ncbi:MAG TPA: hypothetical protein VMV69_10360 [Pirellulales bacterium]|nr:hypothetical protein [Pirellulales bacterium]
MDPQTTWECLLDAYADGDWPTATEHAEALITWLEGGGFPPQTMEARQLRPDLERAIAIAACQLALEKAAQGGKP